ncbi:MAG: hypothetical protein KatS3mg085_788 [Candidatus Dojkabacteria bacterium]|nr:MAG: hypothetical protein KatS3mg085_788 [Candidatus Dojkabacteria bacterium]
MKITVSGWPGAGSSTLTLLLAFIYEFELYQGGGVFRYLFEKLDLGEFGLERIQAQEMIQPTFGKIYDQYIDSLLTNANFQNLIIESDIASFRIGKRADVVSIFLKADINTRISRTQVDGRPADGEVMKEIDLSHENEYKKLHNINFYNEEEIDKKHRLVIDNSDLTIAEEMEKIVEFVSREYRIVPQIDDFAALENEFWSKGKNYFKEVLAQKNLIPKPDTILKDIKNKFRKDVESLPEFLQEVFSKL